MSFRTINILLNVYFYVSLCHCLILSQVQVCRLCFIRLHTTSVLAAWRSWDATAHSSGCRWRLSDAPKFGLSLYLPISPNRLLVAVLYLW